MVQSVLSTQQSGACPTETAASTQKSVCSFWEMSRQWRQLPNLLHAKPEPACAKSLQKAWPMVFKLCQQSTSKQLTE